MVSLWPFKGDSNSAASFEKTLSALSSKISKATTRNDSLRQSARRVRVGFSLYAGFAYILVFVVLTLVTGYRNWGVYEYTIIAGGPPLIYAVREALVAYFNWRIASSQRYLDVLYKERDGTIEKLKTATKYNSTQQLLDKYGSPQPSPRQDGDSKRKKESSRTQNGGPPEPRVFRQPPPTANVPHNRRAQVPASPELPLDQSPISAQPASPLAPTSAASMAYDQRPLQQLNAEFAPNAFSDAPAQYAPSVAGLGQSRWYDRIMDALLGEDETQARNRIALICQRCRLVNGQAPPGTKSLEEVGKWRCNECGCWNGEESETSKLMQHLAGNAESGDGEASVNNKTATSRLEKDNAFPNPSKDALQDGDEDRSGRGGMTRDADMIDTASEAPA